MFSVLFQMSYIDVFFYTKTKKKAAKKIKKKKKLFIVLCNFTVCKSHQDSNNSQHKINIKRNLQQLLYSFLLLGLKLN